MAQDNTTPAIPVEPRLPNTALPGYEVALNRRLTELLRNMALKINDLEKRLKELEP